VFHPATGAAFSDVAGAEDPSAFGCELAAVVFTVEAIAQLASPNLRKVTLIYDCKPAAKLLRKHAAPVERFMHWLRFRRAARSLEEQGVVLQLIWIPSHGKEADVLDLQGVPEEEARAANDGADKAATAALQSALRRSKRKWWHLQAIRRLRVRRQILEYAATAGRIYGTFVKHMHA
jgi:hypothetical protein